VQLQNINGSSSVRGICSRVHHAFSCVPAKHGHRAGGHKYHGPHAGYNRLQQGPERNRFTAVLETNLSLNGTNIVLAGNTVYGRLAVAEQAGRATGSSNLQLELTDIVVDGTAYPIYTSAFEVKGSSSGKRSAKRLLGGAGLGAIIGGIAGNAGMGAAIGVTAGAVGSVAQKGESIQVPSETLISFRLEQPASLPAPY
jgi:hypothetical protein